MPSPIQFQCLIQHAHRIIHVIQIIKRHAHVHIAQRVALYGDNVNNEQTSNSLIHIAE